MSAFRVILTINDSTLPLAQRQVVLEGLAAELADVLASYYHGVEVTVEESYAQSGDGFTTHAITGDISEPYYGGYGGGDVWSA